MLVKSVGSGGPRSLRGISGRTCKQAGGRPTALAEAIGLGWGGGPHQPANRLARQLPFSEVLSSYVGLVVGCQILNLEGFLSGVAFIQSTRLGTGFESSNQ